MDENTENAEILEQMLREAEPAEEPGTLKKKDVIPSDDAPMIVSKLKSVKYVHIYDTDSGEDSLCSRNMLKQHLELKRADGSPVFTTRKPLVAPARGTLKCLLHADGPNRKHYDELGLPTCRKANLTSPFQVTRHMQKRHKQEWETIKSELEAAKEARQERFQEAMVASVGKTVGTPDAPLYVSDKPKLGRPPKK
jgi:hypothetical protein